MSVLSILANTLGGAKSLARFQPVDPATSAPAIDNNGNPILGDMVQETNSAATLAAVQALLSEDAGLATASGQASVLTPTTASATALGTPADAAWSGTGASSIVAALKAIWGMLNGTLKTQLQAGTAAIGTVSLTAGSSLIGSVTSVPISANGTDASNAMPAALTVLATFTVTNPGQYFVQNQSGSTLQVIFDNGTNGAVSTQLLAPGAGANQQGADTTPPMPWFTGRIQVAGATGAQFLARHN